MKKLCLIFSLFSFLLINSSFAAAPDGVSITKNGRSYTINFNLPDLSFSTKKVEGNDFTLINTNYGTTTQVGRPALPQISFNLMITGNEKAPNISVLNSIAGNKTLTSHVIPFQEPWQRNLPLKDRPFNFDSKFYGSNASTGYQFIQVSEPFVIAGVRGVTVTIYPFNYNPSTKVLDYVKTASIKIDLSNPVETNYEHSVTYSDFYNYFFINYEKRSTKLIQNYLIITAPEYEAGLSTFVNHKNSFGFNVSLYTTTTTGTTTTAIKTFIQQLYSNPATKPEFILLVGDTDKIPAWTGSGEGSPKTDLNYVQLEGGDYFADAFIGRFSVASPQQLQNIIDKTIYMENNIGAFPKKNVFMAGQDNSSITEGTHNFVINNYFGPNGYTNLKLYMVSYGATTQQVINAMNDNQMFAIYSGHGGETSWADGPPMSQSQVNGLTNTTIYPFVYSFSCVTGSYHLAECFGETWIRTTNGGVTFYGSSVNSYWDEDDILEKRVFKSMFDESLTKVTPMFDMGKYLLVQHFGGTVTAGSTMLRYMEMYNCMGDPSIETKRIIMPDSTAPDPITNLSAGNQTSNSVVLSWTAPYDSTFGGVTGYDIRYSTTAIANDNDFNAAPQVVFAGQSDTLGTPKSFSVDNLTPNTLYYFAAKAMDMWGNKSPISNVVNSSTLVAPQCAVNPTSISHQLGTASILVDTVYIQNTTLNPSTLNYTVSFENHNYPSEAIQARLIPVSVNSEKGNDKENPEVTYGQSVKGQGGPDQFGYKWIDADESNGPQYVWNDIAATGTLVSRWTPTETFGATDEGYAGPFNLGFNFKFYGQAKTQIYVSTNGFLCFAPLTSNSFSNASIPSTSVPNEIIAPFWDDLDAKAPGTVHYKQDGNKFIMQWTNYQRYSGTASYTWQVVLYQSGKVMVYYKEMTGTINSATVGVENSTGDIGLQVAYDANYVKNNHALQIAAEPDWLSYSGNLSGLLYNGNSAAIELTINSEDYDAGNYSLDMIVNTNDPANPVITVPINMEIFIPVELTAFTAKTTRDEVHLTWQTATETNNMGFEIERRRNGVDEWTEAGFIDGKGTTTEKTVYGFTDKGLSAASYEYRLKQVDFDGTFEYSKVIEVEVGIPSDYVLEQNYPNPFNPSTTIQFGLPVESNVKLTVYNSLGQQVSVLVNTKMPAGFHYINFDASSLASGTYIYRLEAGEKIQTKKMLLMK